MSRPPLHLVRADSSRDRTTRSARLIADLPAAFLTTVFDPRDPHLSGVFMTGSRTTGFSTSRLPLPMQQEISWWLATCDRTGERQVHGSEWGRWAATALDVIRRRPEVCSFADLTLEKWMTEWVRVFHADHKRMPALHSRHRADIALRGMLRRLVLQYSDADWWQHDVWSLKLDARIPRRPHEPAPTQRFGGATSSPIGCGKGPSSTCGCSSSLAS